MQIDAVAQAHPLRTEARFATVPAGQTVAAIVAGFDLPERFGLPQVALIREGRSTVVPLDAWGKVRPKPGTRVEVSYPVNGPGIALAGAAIAAAAPYIATASWGLALPVGGLAAAFATTAITIVGGLLVNALIPPPPQPGEQGRQAYSVTGIQNVENRYGIYPKVLGRHRMYPPKTARGYTETVGEDVYYRGRMTFGWGPLALENLRIGTTPIAEFEDVEIEFLNVDQAQTLTSIPSLAPMVKAWRTGSDAMTLYPDDVFEEPYNILLEAFVETVRVTRQRAESVSIDISFAQGFAYIESDGDVRRNEVTFEFYYRAVGEATWVNAGGELYTGKTLSPTRRTKVITFPEPGEYEVRVIRTANLDEGSQKHRRMAWLTAIRSFRSGGIPSHPGIAEIAIRIRASEQLSGVVDSLNAVVLQLAPVWTGEAWTDLVPVRHPAWVYLDAIRGVHLRRPVDVEKIDLAAFRAWGDEGHWNCDYVVDTPTRLADVLDIIAAAGRAKRALTDMQWSIVRDGGAGPVRQVFTPRNSWGFKGRVEFPRAIHAFRVLARSERLDWEQDEITVYADGQSASTATEFETLELPGVVITADQGTGGNAWRLGRYHLAQAIQRPESCEWFADWEHIRTTRGDKVQIVHDVPVAGVGAARIQAIGAGFIRLDDTFDIDAADFRLTVRAQDGTLHTLTATSPATPVTREWTTAGDMTSLAVGDLVAIEEVAQESLEVLVTGIYPDADGSARLTGVPAAPAVLDADTGTIPPYKPVVTIPRDRARMGPVQPVVQIVASDETTMVRDRDGRALPRIGVFLQSFATSEAIGAYLQMRYREPGAPWVYGPLQEAAQTILLSGALAEGSAYEVHVRSLSETGRSRGWVDVGTITARALTALPPDVTGLAVTPVDHAAHIRWDAVTTPDVAHIELRYSAAAGATWNASVLLDRVSLPSTRAVMFARPGTYFARWVDSSGNRSAGTSTFVLTADQITAQNAVETFSAAGWAGSLTGAVVTARDELQLALTGGVYEPEGEWIATSVVDLGAVYSTQITPYIDATGIALTDTLAGWTSLAAVPSLAPSNPEGWRVEVEVATSATDPTGGSDWRTLSGGDFTGRYFRFRVRLFSSREDMTPRVDELNIVLDMPDRVAGEEAITAPVGGVRITYDPAFHNVPSVVVTPRAAPSGARVEITGKDRTGFDVEFFDASNASIEATFDYVARGYGREAA